MRKTILRASKLLLHVGCLLKFLLLLLVHRFDSVPALASSSSMMILNWNSDKINFHFLFYMTFEILLFIFLLKFLQIIPIQWDLRVLPLWVKMVLRLRFLIVLSHTKGSPIWLLRLKSNIVNAFILLSLSRPIDEGLLEYIVLNLLQLLLLPVTLRRLIQFLLNALISSFSYQLFKIEWCLLFLLISDFKWLILVFKKGQ